MQDEVAALRRELEALRAECEAHELAIRYTRDVVKNDLAKLRSDLQDELAEVRDELQGRGTR